VDSFETLLYEERDGVAVVTLNRPEVHNAFNFKMQEELRELWQALRHDDDVRVVVLTGAGEKSFCTGIDRAEIVTQWLENPDKAYGTGRVGSSRFMYDDAGVNINPKQNDLWKPVVAAVNGMACAGALYLLGEADIIIAAENATFFDPHVTYGMVAGFESVHLYQKAPLGETLRIALLGAHERMSAARAHQIGLVSEVVPAAELMDRAMWIADAIASAPVLAVQGTLRAVWMANETARRIAIEQASMLVNLGTDYDNIEGGQQSFQGQQRIEWQLR
jgi:enoyl-CoA hydratase/carnithine racemase